MIFKDIIEGVILKNSTKHKYSLLGKRFNKLFNGINRGEYIVVAGLPASGKRSFVDNYYVLGLLRQWYATSEETREENPLKIVYFSAKYSEEYKIMKWLANLYSVKTGQIMDIPTMTGGAGAIFPMKKSHHNTLLHHSKMFGEAMEAGVLEIVDTNITSLTIERKLTDVLSEQGEIEYDENGEAIFTPSEANEKALTVVVIDDLNNVRGDKSTFGTGVMEQDEIGNNMNALLKKYADMGMTMVAIKKTKYNKFGMYTPSVKEANGLSPTKCVVMYNPLQEGIVKKGNFEMQDYVDEDMINRLRFSFIAYNETGLSNVYLPLLFMPENGTFAELSFGETAKDIKYNADLLEKYINIRNKH